MNRTVQLSLLSLTLFLLVFPLTLGRPGVPFSLKADESAYYLMALSLAHDQDLELKVEDTERIFQEFPFREIRNVILMTDDGWHTTYFGKPFLFPLFAAPFAAAFGTRGLLFFNMALMMGMVWLGTAYLRRFNSDGISALFSSLFFLLSSAFAYVFWIQTEIFNMAAIFLALFLGFEGEQDSAEGGLWRPLVSGAALALAVYNKPFFAALSLPLVFVALRRRQWKRLGAWVSGFLLCLGAAGGLSLALTGHGTSYLGVVRQGATLCQPGVLPIAPIEAPSEATPAAISEALNKASNSPTGNAWTWMFRLPDIVPARLLENIGYFLWGRHTGLFLYMPFAALALVLFLLVGRRSRERWVLLSSLAIVAVYLLIFLYFNWHGGGGFIGNRYFVNLYPAFLFLVTEIRPRWPMALGAALAGLFLSPILFTPLSSLGPEPTLQHHVRSAPFRYFPFEISLRNVPGYHRQPLGSGRGSGRVVVRKDQALIFGDQIWLRAADRVELWLESPAPLDKATFQIRNLAPRNSVSLKMEGERETLEFATGDETRRVTLDLDGPGRTRWHPNGKLYIYRLVVHSESGRIRHWTRHRPPTPCPYFAENPIVQESFPVGAMLTYLGDGAHLDADLYDLRWDRVEVPSEMPPGVVFEATVRLVNRSSHPWPAVGTARVKVSYHWRGEDGEVVDFDGRRTELPHAVGPGESVDLKVEVKAPKTPGSYQLELDPVFEHVAWFSQRNGGDTALSPVEVHRSAPRPPRKAPGRTP